MTTASQETMMTTEKQRYSGYINRRVGATMFSQFMVSAVMIGSALMLLENLV